MYCYQWRDAYRPKHKMRASPDGEKGTSEAIAGAPMISKPLHVATVGENQLRLSERPMQIIDSVPREIGPPILSRLGSVRGVVGVRCKRTMARLRTEYRLARPDW
jgi:hypothetical protein